MKKWWVNVCWSLRSCEMLRSVWRQLVNDVSGV